MTPQVEIISEQVAERMRQIRTLQFREQILAEAFSILKELGEEECCAALLEASKRIGDKIKNNNYQ